MELAYTAAGNGPAFVLLHAFPLSTAMWERNLARLTERNTVIAPSLRGFGRSPAGKTATMDEMAADVAELMDRLGVKKATIGGLSMGGYVAFAFWKKYPERVRALVLADTRAQGDTPEGKAGRATFADAIKAGGPQVAADKMLPKLLTPTASPSFKDAVRSIIMRNSPEGMGAALLGMGARADFTSELARIQVPTLIVCGEKDELTPPADSKLMAEKIPGAKYVELAGVGHLSNIEAPGPFSEAVAGFLESQQEQAPETRHAVAAAGPAGSTEGDRD